MKKRDTISVSFKNYLSIHQSKSKNNFLISFLFSEKVPHFLANPSLPSLSESLAIQNSSNAQTNVIPIPWNVLKHYENEITSLWLHNHKKRKDILQTRAVLLILLLLELEISGVAVQSIHQNIAKWWLLGGTA